MLETTFALFAGVAFSVLAFFIAKHAGYRSTLQQLTFPAEEKAVLATFLERPQSLSLLDPAALSKLESSGLMDPQHALIFKSITTGQHLTSTQQALLSEPAVSDDDLLILVRELNLASDEVESLGGSGPKGLDSEGKLVRLLAPFSLKRKLLAPLTGAMVALTFMLSPSILGSFYVSIGLLALLSLSIVDKDTLYLDTPVLRLGLLVTLPLAALDIALKSDILTAFLLLGSGFVVSVTLFILANVYERVSGRIGLGLGDLKALPLAALLPALAFRSPTLFVLVISLSFFLRVAVPTGVAIIKRDSSVLRRPEAMIPYFFVSVVPAQLVLLLSGMTL